MSPPLYVHTHSSRMQRLISSIFRRWKSMSAWSSARPYRSSSATAIRVVSWATSDSRYCASASAYSEASLASMSPLCACSASSCPIRRCTCSCASALPDSASAAAFSAASSEGSCESADSAARTLEAASLSAAAASRSARFRWITLRMGPRLDTCSVRASTSFCRRERRVEASDARRSRACSFSCACCSACAGCSSLAAFS
mmetsp:Transcript_21716/g.69945  ORF Transcript_21716/g.69945 Transcript_21716/m.69945 type:complete len:201 (-) Transcript_21716:448-1050(-)